MILQQIGEKLKSGRLLPDVSIQRWTDQQHSRAERVKLFRRYAEGDHPANLSPEMRKLLRIPADRSLGEFTDNYMDIVIQTMVDRLIVSSIDSETEDGRAWTALLMAENRFDAMQSDVHESAVCDGDAYLLTYFDNARRLPRFSHEPAFDGANGMLVVYDTPQAQTPRCAVKVWGVDGDDNHLTESARVNIYYHDRVERYISGSSGLMPYDDGQQPSVAPWVARDGSPLGVPVVHFRNRGRRHQPYGASEIETAIPLQNVLNRTLYSMVMAAELSAFQIRYAIGWTPPAELTPGMWLSVTGKNGGPLEPDDKIDLGTMQQGELVPYLDMARHIAGEIGKITRTPSPEFNDASASGEALKQREIGLIGKVKRFQVRAGNSWEDAFGMAHRIEAAFSDAPPPISRFSTRWVDPEIRNDEKIIAGAVKLDAIIGRREAINMVAPALGWTAEYADQVYARQSADTAATLAASMRGSYLGYGN